MLSTDPTEVPPNFNTIMEIGMLNAQTVVRDGANPFRELISQLMKRNKLQI
ncbi:hypothetical protein GCM10023187_49290 [Nibrella viscosa]|uniref:Uncharacterized protein n=1 Tax=Nibrella viscosa TaxID=1084524 RepID=A0ABP8KWT4_9BACT